MLDLIFTSTGNTSIKLRRIGHPRYTQISANNEPYTVGESIPLSNNQQVEFKIHPTVFYFSESSNDYFNFVIEGEGTVTVSGNINRTPTDYCYYSLFSGCNKLTDASQLQIHQGGDYPNKDATRFCFSNMFKDCTALITPPSSLAASGLADWCYQGMFAGCSKMTSAPQLPATTLAPYCYYAMFYGCSSLTSAPYLSASTLVDWCYNSMFFNCQSLTSISADFIDWNTSGNSTKNWVTGIETIGNFYNDNVDFIHGDNNVPEKWKPDYSTTPLTFVGKAANNAICLSSIGSPDAITLQYNKNNTGWTDYSLYSVIELAENDTVTFSGANVHFSKNSGNYYQFIMTGSIEAKGNIQSLMNYGNVAPSTCYYRLFRGCASLTKAPYLLAATLANECYSWMFYDCSNLSSAPQLPATTLYPYCYAHMFFNCSKLSNAPQLPATELATGCYFNMFYGCSLTSAPQLPATTLCGYCYREMFRNCSSLLSAPVLSASTLADNCYYWMFQGCTSLSSISVAFTDWTQANNATWNWVDGVAANGTFVKSASLSAEYGTSRIPQNWTVINK